jgi:large subunit ribosomal protein L10
MKREKKDVQIRELSEILSTKDSFYLMDFTKVTVGQSVALRKALRKKSHAFRVVKNRLALKALNDRHPEGLRSRFQKPTAIAYTDGDPVDLAKALKEFASQHKVLSIKGGLLQGQAFDPERFEEIVSLGSRAEMLGKFASLMASPLSRLLLALRAPLGSFGSLLAQLKTQREGGSQ